MESDDGSAASTNNPFSYFRLTLFTLTVCGNWFAEPIQSLVDTIVVGGVSTLQLAALGPATMVFDAAIYLCYFLAIATTNLLATAIAKDDTTEQQRVISQSLGVALLLGFMTMVVILGFGTQIFSSMLGSDKLHIVGDAMAYANIRVLNAPASIIGMVCQATCLSYLDTATPALAILVATAINLFGDYLLCVVGNFGIRGAAAATAFAQFMSCCILFRETWKKFRGLADDSAAKGGQKVPLISLPDKSAFRRLLAIGGPIIFVILGEIVCQLILALRATKFGIASLATHNILLRIYFFFATFGDGLSHTAQAYLPRLLYRKSNESSSNKKETPPPSDISIRTLIIRLGILGGFMSWFCSTMAFSITRNAGSLFTSNSAIIDLMKSVSPWMGVTFFLQPFNLLFEGTVIAKGDFNFLVVVYAIAAVYLTAQMRVTSSLAGVWKGWFGFQILRLVQFSVRAWTRKDNESPKNVAIVQ